MPLQLDLQSDANLVDIRLGNPLSEERSPQPQALQSEDLLIYDLKGTTKE